MDDQKELYRLWYEYLKRSENYKEFCEWWGKRKPVKSLSLNDSYKEYSESLRGGRGKPNLMLAPRKFKTGNCLHIPETFGNFLDVHLFPFEDWWIWKSSRQKNLPVVNFVAGQSGSILEGWIDYCIKFLRKDNNREPSAIELKDELLRHLDNASRFGSPILMLNLSYPPKEVKAAFAEYLESKEVKEEYYWTFSEDQFCIDYQRPSGKPRFEDLRQYLLVYDMWKEKVKNRKPGDPSGWAEIIRHFEPHQEHNEDVQERRRVYLRYKQNAEKIISNTEKGHFPGDY